MAKVKEREQESTLFAVETKPDDKPTAKVAKAKATDKPKGMAVAKIEPHPAATGENLLVIIARAAADPACQPDKMRALLDMQKEIRAEDARMAFTTDFIALQDKLPVIDAKGAIVIEGKLGKRGQRTPYATFNEIHRVTKPMLKEHGFALSFATEPSDNGERLIVKGYLDHVNGHQRTTAFPLPAEGSGSKNNAQAWGSSFSYGKRYCTIALLNIVSHAPEDRDLDGNKEAAKEDAEKTDALISGSQAKELLKVIDECGVEATLFMSKYKIGAAHELPAQFYDEAIKNCRDYAARVKAAAKRKESDRG